MMQVALQGVSSVSTPSNCQLKASSLEMASSRVSALAFPEVLRPFARVNRSHFPPAQVDKITMALVNVWHLRKVAEASSKPCDICYKPTTSVLITPDNRV